MLTLAGERFIFGGFNIAKHVNWGARLTTNKG